MEEEELWFPGETVVSRVSVHKTFVIMFKGMVALDVELLQHVHGVNTTLVVIGSRLPSIANR